jgi:hypothetical protein
VILRPTPCPVGNLVRLASEAESRDVSGLCEKLAAAWSLVLLFQPRASLEAEILILRRQLNIQRRQETDFQCHGSPDLC